MSSVSSPQEVIALFDETTQSLTNPGDSANKAVRVNVVAGAGSGGTASTFGAAFPATGTAAGFKDNGGNMAGANLDASGNLLVNVAAGAAGGGIAQTQVRSAGGVWTDVGFAGGDLNMPVQLQSALPAGANTIGKVDQGVGGASPWKVDGSGVTQPVSGIVTANQGGAPWSENISQFGGANVVTGTGVSGAGIPRVTVSSDSFPATQAVSGSVAVSNFPATQPVSGAVSVSNFPATQTVVGTVSATQGTSPWVVALPSNAAQEAGGNLAAIVANDQNNVVPLLQALLTEIRISNFYLQNGLNVRDEADALRGDPYFNTLQ